jgi:hypothetical protein
MCSWRVLFGVLALKRKKSDAKENPLKVGTMEQNIFAFGLSLGDRFAASKTEKFVACRTQLTDQTLQSLHIDGEIVLGWRLRKQTVRSLGAGLRGPGRNRLYSERQNNRTCWDIGMGHERVHCTARKGNPVRRLRDTPSSIGIGSSISQVHPVRV